MATTVRTDRVDPNSTLSPPVTAVSVIVPARNGAHHLRITLPALRRALPEGWEIIVVNDHSTDETAEVAALHADRVILSRAVKSGPAARNSGAQVAKGEVFLFMDQDIRVGRDTIVRLVEGLDEPGVALTFAIYSEGRYLKTLGGRFKNVWVRWSYLGSASDVRWMNTALAAIRRSEFWSTGAYDVVDDTVQGGNDIDFGRLVAERTGRVRLRQDLDCDHLKEMSLGALLRNDFNRARGFFRTAVRSREIESVARGSWFGNISPGFMGGVVGAGLVLPALAAGLLGFRPGFMIAEGALALHLLLALPFHLYAIPRLGGFAPLAIPIYFLDQLACFGGLCVETVAIVARRLRARLWRVEPSPRF